MNNKYLKYLGWAVFNIIDRKTQDDHKSKVNVSAAFRYPESCKKHIASRPNPEIPEYYLPIEDLERFEEFYNFLQDLKKLYGEFALEHIDNGDFTKREIERFRYVLDI